MMSRSVMNNRIFVLLLLAWFLLTLRIGAPWFSHHDSNGAMFSLFVRNYQTYGIDGANFLQIMNATPTTPEHFDYYQHHPILTAWVSTLSADLFGLNEMALRYVSAVATLISISAFYVLCRRLYDDVFAFWAAAIFSMTPMIAYFGRMPNHEPMTLMFMMLFAATMIQWLRVPHLRLWWMMLFLAIAGVWTAWAAVFFLVMFGLLVLWLGTSNQRRMMVVMGVLTFAGLMGLIGFYQYQWSETIAVLGRALFWRTGTTLYDASSAFGPLDWIVRQVVDVAIFMTPSLLIFAVTGLILVLRGRSPMQRGVFVAMMGAGLTYILFFRSAAFEHDFYKIYLIPALSMAASMTFLAGWSSQEYRRVLRPLVVSGMLIAVLFTSGLLYRLHGLNDRDDMQTIIKLIRDETQPDEVVFSNVRIFRLPLGYYTQRTVLINMDAAEAVMGAAQLSTDAVYLYCGVDETPDELVNLAYADGADCRLYRL